MAFDLPNGKTATEKADESWKSQAFVNFSIPTINANGTKGKRKICAAGFQTAKEDQNQLIEWLQADPDNINKLKDMLILDFQMVADSKEVRFDLDAVAQS